MPGYNFFCNFTLYSNTTGKGEESSDEELPCSKEVSVVLDYQFDDSANLLVNYDPTAEFYIFVARVKSEIRQCLLDENRLPYFSPKELDVWLQMENWHVNIQPCGREDYESPFYQLEHHGIKNIEGERLTTKRDERLSALVEYIRQITEELNSLIPALEEEKFSAQGGPPKGGA